MSNLPPTESILSILREASALVLGLQDEIVRIPSRRHLKPDGSFVTEADLQSHQLIVRHLRALTPGIAIVAEEQPSDVNKTILNTGKEFWLLDSLDNTGDYATGGNNYSINLALVGQDGTPQRGALIFPGLGELYYTGDDGAAYKQHGEEQPQRIHVTEFALGPESENIFHDDMKVAKHPAHPSHVEHYLGKPLGFITSRGQRRACLVAMGEVVLCVENEGYYIWDTAPSAAILKAAGGDMFSLEDGECLVFHRGLRLPSYAATACRELAQKMNLFSTVLPPDATDQLLRRSGGIG
jgi:3'(2'), 5'-bisphosphate nucleotidase